jgi:hypothetical protein
MVRLGVVLGMAWATSIGAAIYVGWHMAPGRAAAEMREVPSMEREPVNATPAPATFVVHDRPSGTDAEELRHIVREEVARQGAAACRPDTEAPKIDREPQTAIEPARMTRATDLVDRAIARRQWTRDDRKTWFEITREGPSPTLFELQKKLLAAMNRGDVSPEPGVPPFMPSVPQP